MNVKSERWSELTGMGLPALSRHSSFQTHPHPGADSPRKQGWGLGELEPERSNTGNAGVSLTGGLPSGASSAKVRSIPGLSSGSGLPSGSAPPDTGVCPGPQVI